MKYSLLLFLSLALFLTKQPIHAQNLDIDLLRKINLKRNEKLDGFMDFTSFSCYPVSIASPFLYYGFGLWDRNKTTQQKALILAGAMLFNNGLTQGMKYSFNRARPYITYPYIENQSVESGPSFPSSHTSNAFALATMLTMCKPKWKVGVPSFIYASLIGYSRLHLGVHYPSDVLTGAFVGTGSAWLTVWLNHIILKNPLPWKMENVHYESSGK